MSSGARGSARTPPYAVGRLAIAVSLLTLGCGASHADYALQHTRPRGESRQDLVLLPQGLVAEGRALIAAARAGAGDLDALGVFAERIATELPLALGEHTTQVYRRIAQLTGERSLDGAALAQIDAILTRLDRRSIEIPAFVRRTIACPDYEDDSDCVELWPGYWVEHDDWYCRSDLECPDRFDCVATPGAGAHCGPPEHPRRRRPEIRARSSRAKPQSRKGERLSDGYPR